MRAEFSSANVEIPISKSFDVTVHERAGVLEYIVHAIAPDEIFWFGQEQGVLVQKSVGADGLFRSTVFPGLWLDPAALLRLDGVGMLAALRLGLASPEHAAFVQELARRTKK